MTIILKNVSINIVYFNMQNHFRKSSLITCFFLLCFSCGTVGEEGSWRGRKKRYIQKSYPVFIVKYQCTTYLPSPFFRTVKFWWEWGLRWELWTWGGGDRSDSGFPVFLPLLFAFQLSCCAEYTYFCEHRVLLLSIYQ